MGRKAQRAYPDWTLSRRLGMRKIQASLAELSELKRCTAIDPASETSADDLADTFNSVISDHLDEHGQISEFMLRQRSRQLWFDNKFHPPMRTDCHLTRHLRPALLVQRISQSGVQL